METLTVTILEPKAKTLLEDLASMKLIRLDETSKVAKKPLRFGSMKGLVVYMADDFDAPLDDFKDYM
jgi:hypothetical protein